MNPRQHEHVKPPMLLLHVAFAPQSSVPLTHSLMSMLHFGPSYLQCSFHRSQEFPRCVAIPENSSISWQQPVSEASNQSCTAASCCACSIVCTEVARLEGPPSYPVPGRPLTRVWLQVSVLKEGAGFGVQPSSDLSDLASR